VIFHAIAGQDLESAIRLSLKFQGFISFEKADELFRAEDGVDFDFPVFFRELETLAWLEVQGFANLLWDDDLVFG